jgi:hypothetical protein
MLEFYFKKLVVVVRRVFIVVRTVLVVVRTVVVVVAIVSVVIRTMQTLRKASANTPFAYLLHKVRLRHRTRRLCEHTTGSYTVGLQWCYSGVAVVVQWCYSGFTMHVHLFVG